MGFSWSSGTYLHVSVETAAMVDLPNFLNDPSRECKSACYCRQQCFKYLIFDQQLYKLMFGVVELWRWLLVLMSVGQLNSRTMFNYFVKYLLCLFHNVQHNSCVKILLWIILKNYCFFCLCWVFWFLPSFFAPIS